MEPLLWRPGRMYRYLVYLFLAIGLSVGSADAYTPEHPEVQRLINSGVRFLQTAEEVHAHHKYGSPMLYAYAVHKVNHDPGDPVVQKGIKAAEEFIDLQLRPGADIDHYFTYSGSLAMLLLIEVDAEKYRAKVQRFANHYLSLQKPHGGFSYPSDKSGDNSQNQYAVLAMWTLKKAKFQVDPAIMERVAMYLTRTQDPDGRWAYKGKLAGGAGLVPQDPKTKRMSLTSASAGSILIAGDFFGFYNHIAERTVKSDDTGLPKAIHIYDEEKAKKAVRTAQFNTGLIDGSVGRALNFYKKTPFQFSAFPKQLGFYFYAMYAHERFMSFHERSTGRYEEEPGWYNQGVNDLKRLVDGEGSWGGETFKNAGAIPHLRPKENTAFAVLFLIRSTKKAIAAAAEGIALGGQGLPSDTTNMKKNGNSFVDVASDGVDKLLDLLEQGGDSADQAKVLDSMTLAADPADRSAQIKRLKRMVKGGPWQARRAAARLLGQSSDMDIVPTLIFALSDPDTVVRKEARNGLRFVSRKFEGFGMPDKPNDKQVEDAIRAWKEWYLRANPSYVFIDG